MKAGKGSGKSRVLLIVLGFACVILAAASIFLYSIRHKSLSHSRKHVASAKAGIKNSNGKKNMSDGTMVVKGTINKLPEIDYQKLNKDKKLTKLMEKRKKELGLDKSLDMVVKSDESFKLGKITISMKDILEKTFLKNKKIFEEQITPSGEIKPAKISEYGIYVVQPGDNLWNIHFKLIKEYYKSRGITIPDRADEPLANGFSSGMGKVLKFSEKMVVIYNVLDNKVDTNINLLHPLSKIVVYNMKEVFSFLKEISYKNLDRLRFDGNSLWLSAQQPLKEGK